MKKISASLLMLVLGGFSFEASAIVQRGTARVQQTAALPCPAAQRGRNAFADREGAAAHPTCTAAKNAAIARLSGQVPQACRMYIRAVQACRVP